MWISPRCNSEGTYVQLKSQVAPYPIIVTVGDKAISYDRSFIEPSGTVISNAPSVQFTLSVR
ncbi:MAG: hypothetical protein LH649_16755 [Pseudanabaena sp. CAN_BIN31]|nr:hypothetical protein [Pseudanabaena sp. CAN_BIN31]